MTRGPRRRLEAQRSEHLGQPVAHGVGGAPSGQTLRHPPRVVRAGEHAAFVHAPEQGPDFGDEGLAIIRTERGARQSLRHEGAVVAPPEHVWR